MSASNLNKSRVGFSTGALSKGDFRAALSWLCEQHVNSVELSALRLSELQPLVDSLPSLQITQFKYISFHAPSSFTIEEERGVVELLMPILNRGWNIIVHPDVIWTPSLWRTFGKFLLIENMDRRKPVGRTASELDLLFRALPDARLCLDVAHARQLDTTMTTLMELVWRFHNRIAEIHISELDSAYRHQSMSWCALHDYQTSVLYRFKGRIPTIIESMLDEQNEAAWESELWATINAVTGHKENSASKAQCFTAKCAKRGPKARSGGNS